MRQPERCLTLSGRLATIQHTGHPQKAKVIQVVKYQEKEGLEPQFSEVEEVVERWRRRVARVAPRLRKEFRQRLMISLIYHDAALEGEVLGYSEIKAAIDPTIISDSSLIPSYEQVKRYHDACVHAEQVARSQEPFRLETLHGLHAILAPEEASAGASYRTENPLHRLYYHDIAAPERIAEKMRALGEWLDAPGTGLLHPVELAAETHLRIMAIFPWAKESGRCARIATNLLLRQADYPFTVLHSIDRQAYYEALRGQRGALARLYVEAIQVTATSEIRVYDEAEQAARRAS